MENKLPAYLNQRHYHIITNRYSCPALLRVEHELTSGSHVGTSRYVAHGRRGVLLAEMSTASLAAADPSAAAAVFTGGFPLYKCHVARHGRRPALVSRRGTRGGDGVSGPDDEGRADATPPRGEGRAGGGSGREDKDRADAAK